MLSLHVVPSVYPPPLAPQPLTPYGNKLDTENKIDIPRARYGGAGTTLQPVTAKHIFYFIIRTERFTAAHPKSLISYLVADCLQLYLLYLVYLHV